MRIFGRLHYRQKKRECLENLVLDTRIHIVESKLEELSFCTSSHIAKCEKRQNLFETLKAEQHENTVTQLEDTIASEYKSTMLSIQE